MTPPKTPAQSPAPAHTTPDVAAAITALMTFLQNGSQTRDPQAFDDRQLGIERDFRALLTGLRQGTGGRPGRFDGPVLSPGHLVLGAALPADVDTIAGYTLDRKEVWKVTLADAIHGNDPRDLRHDKIVIEKIEIGKVERLRAFDANGQWILIGYPKITL